MATETRQIILRKGVGVPTNLAEAEAGFATDTDDLFVGTGEGAVIVVEKKGHGHVKAEISDFAHGHTPAEVGAAPASVETAFGEHIIATNPHNIVASGLGGLGPNYRWLTDAYIGTWNSKEPAITKGIAAQYFRGDMSLATFPSLGTVSPINLSANASHYLRGNGTWAPVPSGLETYEPEARLTLFNGSQTIDSVSPTSLSINIGVGGIKKGMIRIKYSTPNIPVYKFTETTLTDYNGAGITQQLSGSAEPPTSYDIMQAFLSANPQYVGNLSDAWDWSQGDLVVRYDSGVGMSYWRFIETNQEFDVVTNEQGLLLHQFEDPDYQERADFTINFGLTNMVFTSPFNQGDASSYTLLSVELLYNK